MPSIIVATDFSQPATNAVHYAAALSHATQSPLVLFHHFIYPMPGTDMPDMMTIYVDDIVAERQQRLEQLSAGLQEIFPGLTIRCVVRSLLLVSDLEELFQEENAALVVLGWHGENPVLKTLFGSVTTRIIREGRLPALIVPQEAAFRPVKKILFSTDGHHLPSPEVFAPLRNLAAAFDAYVEVFTLFKGEAVPEPFPTQPRDLADQNSLDALLDGIPHGYAFENDTAISAGILDEVTRTGADVVGMVSHHHSFFANLLNRSATQQVAEQIHVPLLVLAEKGLA